jgi:lysozyme family protein
MAMATNNFEACLKFTLKFEGGFVNNPKDPGGATNLGVTLFTLSDFIGKKASVAQVKALTVKDVTPIYRKRYWDKVRADDLPAGIDLAVFDFGVHSGPMRAIRIMQRVLGLEDDGNIGDITLKIVRAADQLTLVKEFSAARLAFLQGLPVFRHFANGLTNRANLAEAAALSLLV